VIDEVLTFFLTLGFTWPGGWISHLTRPDPEIAFRGPRLTYRDSLYSGFVDEHFAPTDTRRETVYRNGLPDGPQTEYTKSGARLAVRHFSQGKKVGIHEGWFEDGRRRFHYEYRAGRPDGEHWEWYRSGALSLYARFKDGRLVGKKMWREDGKIYLNYVFLPDRAVGTPGTKLCYQVRGE